MLPELFKNKQVKFNENCFKFAQGLTQLAQLNQNDEGYYIAPQVILEGESPLIPGCKNVIYLYSSLEEDIRLSRFKLEVVPWGKTSDDPHREADILKLDCHQHSVNRRWNWFVRTNMRWHFLPNQRSAGPWRYYQETAEQRQMDPNFIRQWLTAMTDWERLNLKIASKFVNK